MAELWLPSEDRLALRDPLADQLRVTGWRAGPAGVSSVDLTSGLRVVVDHASPTTLTELSVDLHDGQVDDGHLDLLQHLVGEEAAELLRSLPGRANDGRPTRIRSLDEDRFTRRRSRDDHDAFARLALAADLGDDASLSDMGRAVALLEAALASFDLHRPFALDAARRGLSLLAAIGRPRATNSRYQLASLLNAVAEGSGDRGIADAARRAAQDITGMAEAADAARRPAAAAPTAAVAAAEQLASAPMRAAARPAKKAEPKRPSERPLPVDGDHRGWAWLDAGNKVHVVAGRAASNTWARVFREPDRLLLGLSPLRASVDGELKALVVIPPVDSDDLVVDIVADPAEIRRNAHHALARQAVLAGREAARLSRLGHPDADEAWHHCADLWRQVGDTQRANLAQRNGLREPDSAPRGRPGRARALLADEMS